VKESSSHLRIGDRPQQNGPEKESLPSPRGQQHTASPDQDSIDTFDAMQLMLNTLAILKAISERMERCHQTAQIKHCDGSDQFVSFREQSFGDPNTPTQLISTDGDSQYRWTNMYYRPPAAGSVSIIPPASEVAER
jgi:hypothetical protein